MTCSLYVNRKDWSVNILICVKQVPKEEELKLDPVSKTLIRSQGTGTISEYDKYALEMALRIKETMGGKITAVTMGPPQSAEVLRYCLSMGADDVFLLSDRAMGGADAYATVSVLAAAIEHIEKLNGTFDLFLCGKQASDSDTSLVMPQLAEALGLPQVSFVKDWVIGESSLQFWRETEKGAQLVEPDLPAVISVGKTDFPIRYPNIKLKLAAGRREISVLNAEALGLDRNSIGEKGSKTCVGDSYFPEQSKDCQFIAGESHAAAAAALISVLRDTRRI